MTPAELLMKDFLEKHVPRTYVEREMMVRDLSALLAAAREEALEEAARMCETGDIHEYPIQEGWLVDPSDVEGDTRLQCAAAIRFLKRRPSEESPDDS